MNCAWRPSMAISRPPACLLLVQQLLFRSVTVVRGEHRHHGRASIPAKVQEVVFHERTLAGVIGRITWRISLDRRGDAVAPERAAGLAADAFAGQPQRYTKRFSH